MYGMSRSDEKTGLLHSEDSGFLDLDTQLGQNDHTMANWSPSLFKHKIINLFLIMFAQVSLCWEAVDVFRVVFLI